MDQHSLDTLRRADRESERVLLRFDDGSEVEARIREIDWDGHRTMTYMDLNGACGIITVDLDRIESVTILTAR